MNIAMAKRSHKGDPHCGDEYAHWEHDGQITLCIIDGLGHGVRAEEAAQAAEYYIGGHLSEPLPVIFAGCDEEIRHTRGVVMGIAVIDEIQETITYGAIGNTSARMIGGESMRLGSDPGIVGGGYKTLNVQSMGLSPGQVFIMHTDGITEKLDVSGYAGLIKKDLNELADKIIADWGRDTDDVAIVIYRYEGRQH